MISRTLLVTAAFACLVPLGATGAPRGGSQQIVDRTFSCAAGFVGGLHLVDLDVEFSTQPGSSRLRPSAGVTRNMFEAALGYLTPDGVTIHRQLCSPAETRVRLTTTGMRGGAVPSLGAEARCETPRRFLLRVRASFDTPASAETIRQFGFPQLVVRGDVAQAAIAVGTLAGRPIAYLALTKRGTARLFTARTCKED